MLSLKDFKKYEVIQTEIVCGGVDEYCKDTAGNNLGTISYNCNSNVTRIQACINAGHTSTSQTAGGPCQ